MSNIKNCSCCTEGKKKKKPYTSKTYTTGNPQLNIDHFNKMLSGLESNTHAKGLPSMQVNKEVKEITDKVGTIAASSPDGANSVSIDTSSESTSLSESCLSEAKRYVRRYYIKPQNIFCSNKDEVLLALIEHEDENCIVYSLLSLGDTKDVTKLTSKDIIYYYDDGILYDKNHVRIMDYDLSIKHEEQRPLINPEQVSDTKFAAVYADRMTGVTELDEAILEDTLENCCICGEEIAGYGNNAAPYKEGKCCDACNLKFVIPARLASAGHTLKESLTEAIKPYALAKDFATVEAKIEFNKKWTSSLNNGTDKINSCVGSSFTIHYTINGREQKWLSKTVKVKQFFIGRASNEIIIKYSTISHKEGLVKLNGFFGRLPTSSDTLEKEYFLTTDDDNFNRRIEIYQEDRQAQIKGYKNTSARTVQSLSDAEKAEVKAWLFEHTTKIQFEVPAGDTGYTTEEGPIDQKRFEPYAARFKGIQLKFCDAYPEARNMKIGETREIGKNVFVTYFDVQEQPQVTLSYYKFVGLRAIIFFDQKNSQLPDLIRAIVNYEKTRPEAKQASAKDIDNSDNMINSIGFVNAVFYLFDDDVNFLANKHLVQQNAEDIPAEISNENTGTEISADIPTEDEPNRVVSYTEGKASTKKISKKDIKKALDSFLQDFLDSSSDDSSDNDNVNADELDKLI